MPAALVKSFAHKGGKSVEDVERHWDKAKEIAKQQGHEGEYGYIVGILKRMERIKKESVFEIVCNGILNEKVQ